MEAITTLEALDLKSVFSNSEHNPFARVVPEPGDYYENGILHCGKCHDEREYIIPFSGADTYVGIMCQCKRAERDKENQRLEEQNRMLTVRKLRDEGFHEAALKDYCFANDDYSNPELTDAMKNYVDDFEEHRKTGQSFLLYGSCGTGKTFAAVCVANALLDKAYPVVVTSMSHIAAEVSKSGFNKGDYIESLNRCDLLVIDDLGRERRTEYMTEIVGEVVDSRVRAKKPMIITTNLSLAEIKEPKAIEKQRIYDRIIQVCMPFEVKNENRRYAEVRRTYEQKKEKMFRPRPAEEKKVQPEEYLDEIPF